MTRCRRPRLPGISASLALSSLLAVSLVALLVAATPAPVRAGDHWVIDTSGYPTVVAVFRVASQVWGSVPVASGTGEVAVEVVVLADGESVPLPTYASDGASAAESEVFWTLALESAICEYQPPSSAIEASFSGRELFADWSSCHNPGPSDLRFRATVIAVRGAAPSPVEGDSFGGVKARYR